MFYPIPQKRKNHRGPRRRHLQLMAFALRQALQDFADHHRRLKGCTKKGSFHGDFKGIFHGNYHLLMEIFHSSCIGGYIYIYGFLVI